MQAACLPATSVAQLLREAALREEWRRGREEGLLATLRGLPGGLQAVALASGPGGGLSAADGRLLSEHVTALTEMIQQSHTRRRYRTNGRVSPGKRSSAPGADRRGGSPYRGTPTSSSTGGPPTPTRMQQQHFQQNQQYRPPGSGSGSGAPASSPSPSSATVAIYGSGGAVVGSPARALRAHGASRAKPAVSTPRSGGSGSGSPVVVVSGGSGPGRSGIGTGAGAGAGAGAGGGAGSSPGTPTRRGANWGRPGSAPEERLALAEGGAAAAALAEAAARAVDDGSGPGGEGQRSSGFRQLLKLQQLLMAGIREHVVSDGEVSALDALGASVAEGQALFADCLAEAAEAAGLPAEAAWAPLGPGTGTGTGSGPGPTGVAGSVRGSVSLGVSVLGASGDLGSSWESGGPGARAGSGLGPAGPRAPGSPSRRLPLAAWDRLLRLGQLGLTRADVARLDEIRRSIAARIIQRQVRRWLRRKRHLKRLAEARARAHVMQRRLRERAAVVIQAHIRGHLARRLAAGLAAQAEAEAAGRRAEEAARGLAALRIQRAWRAHVRVRRYGEALARAEAARAAVRASQELGLRAPPSEVRRAVIVIQAHVRGWLVRRSSDLWWARASCALRQRRAAVRAWRAHQRFMSDSYDMQAQLLGALVREAQVAEALSADRRRQETEMEAAFSAWLLGEQRVALSQALPRGWVPHPHPEDPGRLCFLNTRTGELHSLHPAVAELAQHAAAQHAAAAAALAARFAGVPAYVEALHAATAQQAGIAMRAIAVMWQRAAALAAAGGLASAGVKGARGSGGGAREGRRAVARQAFGPEGAR
ncbi:hypothetical protein HYH03_017175 [Edaphochlamys debaryana]|uniref:Uncharacterized protein n=1 Tax=Edaphochlamys debaryana TaxID=47281 RepID=A0A835XH64_9CHLO|nr:hypothetical protein HYH03_017175 [Edaphochlamys debaryana]|eukprot:KAG2484008.1 hypothetical protein HYH03_017175 [Edaphochlamys debaryana]